MFIALRSPSLNSYAFKQKETPFKWMTIPITFHEYLLIQQEIKKEKKKNKICF